jgi:uncharacterized protein YdhG (YjbR/CyaY superfamily)
MRALIAHRPEDPLASGERMGGKPASTDEYLATLTAEKRAALEALRETVRAAAPGAEEGFSYGMPLFRLGGKPLVWLAAWKHHYGLYPLSAGMLAALGHGAEGFETAKGTIRFPASRPPPAGIVNTLVRARIAELKENGR